MDLYLLSYPLDLILAYQINKFTKLLRNIHIFHDIIIIDTLMYHCNTLVKKSKSIFVKNLEFILDFFLKIIKNSSQFFIDWWEEEEWVNS